MNKSTILRKGPWGIGLVLVLGAGVAVAGFAGSAQRPDCPGTIECPLTGEEVCRDQCPLVDASRADCPGKIECSLTGELVCRDKCPLGTSATDESDEAACCRVASAERQDGLPEPAADAAGVPCCQVE